MLYLGDNPIAGLIRPIATRNIGEIVASSLPLTDAGLHLLDGSLILGGGIYQGFVDYIADLYNSGNEYTYIQPTNPTGITSTSGWNNVSNAFDNNPSTYTTISNTTGYIEWDFGQTLGLTGISINGSWESGVAHNVNFIIYSVNSNNEETLIAHTSGSSQSVSYITSATFAKVNCNKIRIYADDYYSGAPARVIQINITATSTRPQYFTSEADWQQSVTIYGVCGKFVYDSVNNTVRLPKITGIIEGTTDASALGDLVEAGLPIHTHTRGSMNITGEFGRTQTINNNSFGNGAFTCIYEGLCGDANNGATNQYRWTFDASRNWTGSTSNPNYSGSIQNSSTVQPQTIKAFYYIVIANSTKTEIQSDIDEVATDLNGKVDKADLQEVQCVVETYQNGTSWYRVYSDGWCEQGGFGGEAWTYFLKPFLNTNYTIITCAQGPNADAVYGTNIRNDRRFTDRFYPYYSSSTITGAWYACGYIEV